MVTDFAQTCYIIKECLLIQFKFIGVANVKHLNDVSTFSKETTFHTRVASTRGYLRAYSRSS